MQHQTQLGLSCMVISVASHSTAHKKILGSDVLSGNPWDVTIWRQRKLFHIQGRAEKDAQIVLKFNVSSQLREQNSSCQVEASYWTGHSSEYPNSAKTDLHIFYLPQGWTEIMFRQTTWITSCDNGEIKNICPMMQKNKKHDTARQRRCSFKVDNVHPFWHHYCDFTHFLCKMFITAVLHFLDKTAIVTFYKYNPRNILQLHDHTMTAEQRKL